MATIDEENISMFREIVWAYYHAHGRMMPWRQDTRPYYILVSELMLQQTQVERVIPKFTAFIQRFPTTAELAAASLAEVLQLWSGLGYYRRAKYLWLAARMIEQEFAGEVPTTQEALQKLPGVGPNTAGAIATYAYDQPVVFIETNIRTVLFHHFFADHPQLISDRELRQLAMQTFEHEHPREWYWALMDYGTHLKKTARGRLDQSKHYKKQSPLKGSVREVRGQIIRLLAAKPLSEEELRTHSVSDSRFEKALAALESEGLILKTEKYIQLRDA